MIDNINFVNALMSLRPKAKWTSKGNDITWLDTKQIQPTQEEIDAEVVRLQTEYDGIGAVQRNRAKEYPSIADQLDEIYHNGIDSWKSTIKVTKDKYPK